MEINNIDSLIIIRKYHFPHSSTEALYLIETVLLHFKIETYYLARLSVKVNKYISFKIQMEVLNALSFLISKKNFVYVIRLCH